MTHSSTRVVTDIVRLSYAHIWEPTSVNGGEPRYSCSVIIPKSDTETVEKIRKAVGAALREGAPRFGGVLPPMEDLRLPLRDGDRDRDDEAYRDSWFITASRKTAPDIVDVFLRPVTDRSEVYSGCYARVSLAFFAYCNEDGNKGVACRLGNIQKIRDGERLGGPTSAAEDFGVQIENVFGE